MEKDLFSKFSQVSYQELMKNHTSFRLGGPVDVFIEPQSPDEIQEIIRLCKEESLPWMVLGKGTNLIISDQGLDGVIIHMGQAFEKIEKIDQKTIRAYSGASLKDLAEFALDLSLEGLEFAHGIPGSVGGAITMNAGAYDGECVQAVKEVCLMTRQGQVKVLSNEEMDFAYRHSRVQEEKDIVLWASFALEKGDPVKIQDKMEDLWQRRLNKQPLEYPSAGSTFKRPPGHYAGQLIDQAGCRGLYHRGAQVSQKHCGFVINKDGATTQAVVELIETVQKLVKDQFGVDLETEVKVLGR